MDQPNENLELIDKEKWNEQVAAAFQVPPHLMGEAMDNRHEFGLDEENFEIRIEVDRGEIHILCDDEGGLIIRTLPQMHRRALVITPRAANSIIVEID